MFYETNFVRHTISNEEIEQLRAAGFGHIADKLGVLNEKYTEIQKANVHAELVKSDVLKENEYLACEILRLEAIKFKHFNDEEHWIFQDDGDDNLHSLVCPVTMHRDKAIELVEYRKKYKELEQCFLRHSSTESSE
tara:strand:- start:401 stop:808 length:408 start_codon:yes stop_codon:yes gene_type:complete